MHVDLKGAVLKNMTELKKAISDKSSEVAQLRRELERHESILALLSQSNGRGKMRTVSGRRRGRGDLNAVLNRLPETFTSKEFVKAGTQANKTSIYLRQVLSRWARTGKLKRLQRGKYQKTKKGVQRLAA
ncbi:MAG: hypothetical protein ACREQ7_02020 [Candidatus Binatia bacterium]